MTEPEPDEDGKPPDPSDIAEYQRTKQQLEAIKNDSAAQKRVLENVRQHRMRENDRMLAYLNRPLILPPAKPLLEGSLEAAIFVSLSSIFVPFIDRFLTDRIQIQLLAVHAAICGYQWEFDKLPESLDVLRLGKLAIDPYSEKPLLYRKLAEGYELSSIGPLNHDDATPLGGRVPIFLPNRRR